MRCLLRAVIPDGKGALFLYDLRDVGHPEYSRPLPPGMVFVLAVHKPRDVQRRHCTTIFLLSRRAGLQITLEIPKGGAIKAVILQPGIRYDFDPSTLPATFSYDATKVDSDGLGGLRQAIHGRADR